MKVLVWGTYDLGKPRVRILLKGLEENDVEIIQCHFDIWKGIEDKSQVKSISQKTGIFFRYLLAYPLLIIKYLIAPKHDVILVPYMAQFDVIMLRPFAWLRKRKIVMDAFLSLYNTVVEDRKILQPTSVKARLFKLIDNLACRAADKVIVDTMEHGKYFSDNLNVSKEKISRIFVGVEEEYFPACDTLSGHNNDHFQVLFYGQFIPLHGIESIIEAATLSRAENISWKLIGQGQVSEDIDQLIKLKRLKNVDRIDWVPYSQLINHICDSDICLGVFGTGEKSSRVIPNKVFQVLSSGKPLVTADTPAIRELLSDGKVGKLIQAGSGNALVKAVLELRQIMSEQGLAELSYNPPKDIYPKQIGMSLLRVFEDIPD